MPVQPRPQDTFTRENLLLGFSLIDFRPLNVSTGQLGTPVPLGILSGEELAKEVNVLELPDGSAGTISVAREVLSSLKPSFNIDLFNFRADVAQYIFGAASLTPVVANPAQPIVNEPIQVQSGADATRTFIPLRNADVDPTPGNLTLTAQPIVNEDVGTGDGATGAAQGDFSLAFKPLVFGDVTRVDEVDASGNLVQSWTPIASPGPPAAGEVQVEAGTAADSGELTFFANIGAGNTILADYAPSHDMAEDETAANVDMHLDSLLGRIRFPALDSPAAKALGPVLRETQIAQLSYLYNRAASTGLQPFTQGGGVFQGACTIRHLPDVGVNFVWEVPSASIRIDDNSLVFGADDFVTGTIVLNLNDAGGSERFGTMQLSSEPQSAI